MEIRDITLRINGIEEPVIGFRYRFVDEFPGGDTELVIQDPLVGDVVLSSNCKLEIRRGRGRWSTVTLPDFIKLLDGYVRKHL